MPAPIQSALKTSGRSHSTNAVGLRPMDWIASNLRRFSATFEASTCRWLRRRKPRISVALCVWRNSPWHADAPRETNARGRTSSAAIGTNCAPWHCNITRDACHANELADSLFGRTVRGKHARWSPPFKARFLYRTRLTRRLVTHGDGAGVHQSLSQAEARRQSRRTGR